ncbi:Protein of unknown function, partial [Gryllus bimaculatus]
MKMILWMESFYVLRAPFQNILFSINSKIMKVILCGIISATCNTVINYEIKN